MVLEKLASKSKKAVNTQEEWETVTRGANDEGLSELHSQAASSSQQQPKQEQHQPVRHYLTYRNALTTSVHHKHFINRMKTQNEDNSFQYIQLFRTQHIEIRLEWFLTKSITIKN